MSTMQKALTPPLLATATDLGAEGAECGPAPSAVLPNLTHPAQVATLSLPELHTLAQEIRTEIITTTSRNGGHVGPSLGVVELTLAMLAEFNPEQDKIVWDVGHQAYAYKLLTGRKDQFHTLRQLGGISGFPRREESPYDHFGVGHSSTSISSALGMAVARDMKGEKHHVVSVIGDGALTAGLAFEGMNQVGARGRPFIVILNDNEMSISKNVGALSLFMSRNLSARWVRRVKKEVEGFLKSMPGIGEDLYEIARRSKHSFKNFFTPGILFEALNFNYIGAVDGHDIEALQKVLRLAKTLDKPVLVHVLTQKGKGFAPAEASPEAFHGVGRFDPETGTMETGPTQPESYTAVFGKTLCALAEQDPRVVAITAAMPAGTGLGQFSRQFPERFFDVGICEQHALTFAAGLATQGFKPFVCVYSTFMQRAYDQIVHDVCVQNLPVTLCLDRAGLVGEDGATHHGVFDISFLRHIPNMVMVAPKNEQELRHALAAALAHNGPFALRYPRGAGTGTPAEPLHPLPIGQAEWLEEHTGGIALLALGSCVAPTLQAAKSLHEEGIYCSVINARWIKPLPENDLKKIAATYDKVLIVEEHSLAGGFSSAILEFFADAALPRIPLVDRIGLPDAFVEHGPAAKLRELHGLHAQGIAQRIRQVAAKIPTGCNATK